MNMLNKKQFLSVLLAFILLISTVSALQLEVTYKEPGSFIDELFATLSTATIGNSACKAQVGTCTSSHNEIWKCDYTSAPSYNPSLDKCACLAKKSSKCGSAPPKPSTSSSWFSPEPSPKSQVSQEPLYFDLDKWKNDHLPTLQKEGRFLDPVEAIDYTKNLRLPFESERDEKRFNQIYLDYLKDEASKPLYFDYEAWERDYKARIAEEYGPPLSPEEAMRATENLMLPYEAWMLKYGHQPDSQAEDYDFGSSFADKLFDLRYGKGSSNSFWDTIKYPLIVIVIIIVLLFLLGFGFIVILLLNQFKSLLGSIRRLIRV